MTTHHGEQEGATQEGKQVKTSGLTAVFQIRQYDRKKNFIERQITLKQTMVFRHQPDGASIGDGAAKKRGQYCENCIKVLK